MKRRTIFFFCILWVILLGVPALNSAQEKRSAIEPKADKILRQMSDYLNSLGQFTLHTENGLDTVLASGQKLQLSRAVDVFVRRPNRLRANVRGDILKQQFFYDGKSITLYGRDVNYYATIAAPANIEAALDHAVDSFDLVAPLADLIYRNSYDILTENVESGFYVGPSNVLGIECHHLAFRQEDIDWQIWIEKSETPLPRKLIITSKWLTGAPQFTALLTDWKISARLNDKLFTFVVPDNAEKIEFLPTEKVVTYPKKAD
jgi:hypothetical protein